MHICCNRFKCKKNYTDLRNKVPPRITRNGCNMPVLLMGLIHASGTLCFSYEQRNVFVCHLLLIDDVYSKTLSEHRAGAANRMRSVVGRSATAQGSDSSIRDFMNAVLNKYSILFYFTHGIDNNGVGRVALHRFCH